jgi:hypothetical protein
MKISERVGGGRDSPHHHPEKLTFSTNSDSKSTKGFAYSSSNNSYFVDEHYAKDALSNSFSNLESRSAQLYAPKEGGLEKNNKIDPN